MADYDVEKLTKLSALKQLAQKIKDDYVTSTDFTPVKEQAASTATSVSQLSGKVTALETAGAEKNVIEVVKVNTVPLEVEEKTVDITVPTAVSQIANDSGFKNETEVKALITAEIDTFTKNVTENDTVDTFKELVDYVATHAPEAADMAADIESLNTLVGGTSVSEQITAALAGYVKKDGAKVLSTNDYTAEDKAKVDAINYATEEEVTAMLEEVFNPPLES